MWLVCLRVISESPSFEESFEKSIWGIHLSNTFEIILAAISWSYDLFACEPFHNCLHLKWFYLLFLDQSVSDIDPKEPDEGWHFPFSSFFFPSCPFLKQVMFYLLYATWETWFKIDWNLWFRIEDSRFLIYDLIPVDLRLKMSAFHKLSARLLTGQMVNMGRWKF